MKHKTKRHSVRRWPLLATRLPGLSSLSVPALVFSLFLLLTGTHCEGQAPLISSNFDLQLHLPHEDTNFFKQNAACGLTPTILQQHGMAPLSNQQGVVPVASFPPHLVETCGRYLVYYEDLISPPGGFSDMTVLGASTVGQVRRNTFCAVLNDLQNTMDYSAVGSGYIRLFIHRSFSGSYPAPPGTGFLGYAASFYDNTLAGITSGFTKEYVASGVDPAPNAYHATVTMNFDGIDVGGTKVSLDYNDGTAPVTCGYYDLYSVLLHEMTHTLGWFSLLDWPLPAPGSPLSAYNNLTPSAIYPGEFSGLDDLLHAGQPGASFTKVILGAHPVCSLNTSPAVNADNNYWTGSASAPNNYPVASGALTGAGTGVATSYFSHLDGQAYVFSARERLASGEHESFVMSPSMSRGVTRRMLTKGEIQTLISLGYSLTPSYLALSPSTLTNTYGTQHPFAVTNNRPYSTRMAGYPDDYWKLHLMYPEMVAADFTLANTGTPLTISLPSDATLVDPDGDPVSVFPGSVINIRGCGSGGNNSSRLTVNSGGTAITYTPRSDFYGRAQFGFNLYDGKEKGAYVVYTIDVTKGSISAVPGTELVLNGSFEEGTETARRGLTDELIDNAENVALFQGERRFGGSLMGDSHPYNFLGCGFPLTPSGWGTIVGPGGFTLPPGFANGNGYGDIVEDLYVECSTALVLPYPVNTPLNSAFGAPGGNSANWPPMTPNGGLRYGKLTPTQAAAPQGQFFLLKSDVQQCRRYTLEFDARSPQGSSGFTPATYLLKAGFLNYGGGTNWFSPSMNYTVPASVTTFTINAFGWQHIVIPDFYYCSSSSSDMLYLDIDTGASRPPLLFDNLSLKENISPTATTATVAQVLASPPCTVDLRAGTTPGLTCGGVSYSWQDQSGGSLGSGQSITVPYQTANYMLTVNDGCSTKVINVPVFNPHYAAGITASPAAICIGDMVTLTSNSMSRPAPTGRTYSWSPASGLSCPTCPMTTDNPTSTTTYTLTTTVDGCSYTDNVTVTVNPLPVVTASASPAAVCPGTIATLSAGGAASYSWTPATGLACPSCATTAAAVGATTTYTVTGTDANGCVNTASTTVTAFPAPAASITATPGATLGATLTASPSGTGFTYFWTDPLGNNYTTQSVAGNLAGTYTLVVTDASTGCTGTATIFINAPCPAFTNTFPAGTPLTVLSGTLTGYYPPGAYFLSGAVTVSGGTTFDNCMVLMENQSSIYVTNGAQLDIVNQSHLATCPGSTDMWKGITLANDYGRIRVLGASLIEDALTAILSKNMINVNATGYLIETNDAIFNRNREGIVVDNDPNNTAMYKIENTVFTSRDLASAFNSWPSPATLKLPPTTWPTGYDVFMPPYRLNASYQKQPCKDLLPALVGLRLDRFGNTTGSGPSSYTYNSFRLGSEASANRRNYFDNMRNGVESFNSNLIVANTTFTEMFRYASTGGIGVLAHYNTAQPLRVTQLMVLTTTPSAPRNEFYENVSGVEAYHNYKTVVSRAFFQTTNKTLSMSGPGRFGMLLQSGNYRELNADFNQFKYCVNSVFITTLSGSGLKGQVFAQGNIITGWKTALYNNQNSGIQIDEVAGTIGNTTHTIRVQSNRIDSTYHGIIVGNLNQRKVEIYNNVVKLRHDAAALGSVQFGIYAVNCANPQVSNNQVSGMSSTNEQAHAYYFASDAPAPFVGCNTESNIGRGFMFANTMNGTEWIRNEMSGNRKAFLLFGDIGQQGLPSFSSGNRWTGSWSSPNAVQTHTDWWLFPPASAIYGNGSSELPTVHTSFGSPSNAYSPSSILSSSSSSWGSRCHVSVAPPFYLRTAGPTPTTISMEKLAQDSVDFGNRRQNLSWMAQYDLYRQLQADPGMGAASSVLGGFQIAAASSRMGWVARIDSLIGAGNDAAAAKLLSTAPPPARIAKGSAGAVVTDGTGADSIVANYTDYYRLLIAWNAGTFSAVDSAQLSGLAAKCPLVQGTAVYQARALLRIVTHDLIVYNDDCFESGKAVEKRSSERRMPQDGSQDYSLAPNPNDGHMQLRQYLTDGNPVQIRVMNSIGATVHRVTQTFEGNTAVLELSHLVPGMYHILLQDASGASWTLKFVKQ